MAPSLSSRAMPSTRTRATRQTKQAAQSEKKRGGKKNCPKQVRAVELVTNLHRSRSRSQHRGRNAHSSASCHRGCSRSGGPSHSHSRSRSRSTRLTKRQRCSRSSIQASKQATKLADTLSPYAPPSRNKATPLCSRIQRPSTPPKCPATRDTRELTRAAPLVTRSPASRKRSPRRAAQAVMHPCKRHKIEQEQLIQAPSRRELPKVVATQRMANAVIQARFLPPQQTLTQMSPSSPVAKASRGANTNLLSIDPAPNSGAAQVPSRQSARSVSEPAIHFASAAMLWGRGDASPISVESSSQPEHTEKTPLKPRAGAEGEKAEVEKYVFKDQCPPLSVLQGKWRSSFGDQRVIVDLIWLQMGGCKMRHVLKRDGNKWMWFGWTLVSFDEKALHWEKEDKEVVWTRVGPAPKLQCNKFDLTGKTKTKRRSNACDALGILKHNFNVLDSVCKNPNSELYGLEFTGSKQGVFAACLLTRVPEKKMNIIVYIATRGPVQNVGIGKWFLEELHALPLHAPGDRECTRWAALVGAGEKYNALQQWWRKRNYGHDISDEIEEFNPFSNCGALERGDQRKNGDQKENKAIPIPPVIIVEDEPSQVPIPPVVTLEDEPSQSPIRPVTTVEDEPGEAPIPPVATLEDEPGQAPIPPVATLEDEPSQVPISPVATLEDEPRQVPIPSVATVEDEPRQVPIPPVATVEDEPGQVPIPPVTTVEDNPGQAKESQQNMISGDDWAMDVILAEQKRLLKLQCEFKAYVERAQAKKKTKVKNREISIVVDAIKELQKNISSLERYMSRLSVEALVLGKTKTAQQKVIYVS